MDRLEIAQSAVSKLEHVSICQQTAQRDRNRRSSPRPGACPRRYEDASLRYTGIESHSGLIHYGLYDTVVAKDA